MEMAHSASINDALGRLAAAQVRMREILVDQRKFGNECEEIFSEFRRACMHLKNKKELLDSVEDKETPVRFMCKFCRARPPYHGRCEEVLKILMLSEAWKRQFMEDPEADISALPASIADDLRPAADIAGGLAGATAPPAMVVVVQRCTRGEVPADPEAGTWTQISRGLLICVAFGEGASASKLRDVARSLLTAPLSNGAQSVIALCKRGEEQGLLIVPQPSLLSQLVAGSAEVQCRTACPEEKLKALYDDFIAALTAVSTECIGQAEGTCLPKVVAASATDANHQWQINSDGMMHSFSF